MESTCVERVEYANIPFSHVHCWQGTLVAIPFFISHVCHICKDMKNLVALQ